jgi:cysteine sulfinate desulfinase/cysteine desulfurase-like protein
LSNRPIYLDYNATTPHAPEGIEAMRPYLEEHFGNLSSFHWYVRKTHEAVKTARSQVAALLNCTPAEVLFTSGGTESNNHAIREGISLARFMEGAGQEGGRRPGTGNVLEIVGLGKTCEIAHRDLAASCEHLRRMRDRLEAGLLERVAYLRVNGHPENRLPNTLSASVEGLDAGALLAAIEDKVAASGGAACHSGHVHVSHVLQAMRIPEEWARGTLRFSMGRMTSEEDIDAAGAVVADAAERLRSRRMQGEEGKR